MKKLMVRNPDVVTADGGKPELNWHLSASAPALAATDRPSTPAY
jgi:hypothetical protein